MNQPHTSLFSWRKVLVLAAMAALAVCSRDALAQDTASPKKRAFVVGVSSYAKSGLRDLDYGAKDAEDLKSVLESLGFEVTALIGAAATKQEIESEFAQFMKTVNRDLGKDDIVLVFFSGHGLQKLVNDPGNEGVGGRGTETPFFCPHDCLAGDPATLVSLNSVINQLKESSSDKNIMLMDCCRNNPSKGAVNDGANREKSVDGSTVRDLPNKLNLLFSSSDGGRSWESDREEVKQGVFTHVLLQGLRGAAADSQGEITWVGLAKYIWENVPKEAERLVGQGTKQQPNWIMNSGLPILLGRVNKGTANVVLSGNTPSTSLLNSESNSSARDSIATGIDSPRSSLLFPLLKVLGAFAAAGLGGLVVWDKTSQFRQPIRFGLLSLLFFAVAIILFWLL
jgi:hypothetical protein